MGGGGDAVPVIETLVMEGTGIAREHNVALQARKAFENAGVRFISGYVRGAVLRENRGEPAARTSTPAVSVPASKPVKPIQEGCQEGALTTPKGLK